MLTLLPVVMTLLTLSAVLFLRGYVTERVDDAGVCTPLLIDLLTAIFGSL